MRLRTPLLTTAAFVGGGVVSIVIAWTAAMLIENRTEAAVRSQLLTAGMTWTHVRTTGLQVRLSGEAPNEAARFRAVNLVGAVVDASRVRDRMTVAPVRAIEAPRFSVEMLRNTDGLSVIGLLPASVRLNPADPEPDAADQLLRDEVSAIAGDLPVSDMLETAAFPAPDRWSEALTFGTEALKLLPRSKISVAADRVAITAISDSDAQKRRLETELAKIKPAGLEVVVEISAPRPVLTPFTLRFIKDAEGARFDACSADTDRARDRILRAGTAAGVQGTSICTVGLGVPTPSWAEAVEAGIKAVEALGGGSITFSDADVTLLAEPGASQATFDQVVGELQTALPAVFSLKSTLPPKPDAKAQGPAEFTATLSPEGRVQLRGRLTDALLKSAVDSYAKARFGADQVYTATRFDEDLPDGWPVRVLAGLEALAELHDGRLTVRADMVELTGVSGNQGSRARVSQILSGKLGQGQSFRVSVRYDEALDPFAALPSPQECAASLNKAVATSKINFAPGSAEIDGPTGETMDALAKILQGCPVMKLEIAGHTDAQGSTEGNLALSQARAEAVLLALQGRRVDISGMVAKGYGEGLPIADNGTEEGREANRRIEFTLLEPAAPAEVVEEDQVEATARAAEGEATPDSAPAASSEEDGPDFSRDTSPSIAPKEITSRPKPRPEQTN
ncbi:BON domain-containing protein [Gemmobacter lutimaris]|uniref:BON domain-containing protein n=1 Tax=Gemmobacter lutimaris TaxID=2306023 RepID=A0A398BYE4_9RHOB|nr:OmpA family protein [Gemmobacter lutimaris]RID92323.1 BON domain-containing protein [Gemmobacter lutimaris]